MKNTDRGMTILEVVFAITILLIGAGFMAKSNAVTFKYRDQSTEYKQVLFYAAGQTDAVIETRQTVSESVYMPFESFDTFPSFPAFTPGEADGLGDYLEKMRVEVSSPGLSPIIIYSYRLK